MVEMRIQAALAMRSSLLMESLLRVIENGLEPQVARAVAGLVEELIPGFLGKSRLAHGLHGPFTLAWYSVATGGRSKAFATHSSLLTAATPGPLNQASSTS